MILIYKQFLFLYTSRYLKKDTAITIKEHASYDIESEEKIPFIDLIICPEFFVAYNKNVLEYYGIEKENYRQNGNFYPNKNGKNIDPRNLLLKASHGIEDILIGIQIKTLNKENPYVDIEFNQNKNNHNNLYITTKFWNTFGRCYSIRPSDKVRQLGVVSMIFEGRMDFYVYFGHPGQFLSANRNQKVCELTFLLLSMMKFSYGCYRNSIDNDIDG